MSAPLGVHDRRSIPPGGGGGGPRVGITVCSVWSTLGYTGGIDFHTNADYVCDGVNDEVTINAALQGSSSARVPVFLVGGAFYINGAILVQQGQMLIGSNRLTSIYMGAKIVNGAFVEDTGWNASQGLVMGQESYAAHLAFHGGSYMNPPLGPSAILDMGSTNAVVERCKFEASDKMAAQLYGSGGGNVVQFCEFSAHVAAHNSSPLYDPVVKISGTGGPHVLQHCTFSTMTTDRRPIVCEAYGAKILFNRLQIKKAGIHLNADYARVEGNHLWYGGLGSVSGAPDNGYIRVIGGRQSRVSGNILQRTFGGAGPGFGINIEAGAIDAMVTDNDAMGLTITDASGTAFLNGNRT